MTTHELSTYLLTFPDLPVQINGWGSDEGLGPFEVTTAYVTESANNVYLDYED